MRYIIDGYNFLFRLPQKKGASLETRRKILVDSLREELSEFPAHALLIFDSGDEVCDYAQVAKWPHLDVIYAPRHQSADDYIVELIEQEQNPHMVTVVTSDAELAKLCKYHHVRIATIEEFLFLIRKKQNKKEQLREEKKKKDLPSEIERLRKIFEEKLNDLF